MPPSILNLLARWLILALGVLIATRIVPGIRCDGGSTLVVVVVLIASAREWVLVASKRKPALVRESPFVQSVIAS